MQKIFVLFAFITFLITAAAQSLPRRVYIGIRMENLTADTRRIMEIDTSKGVLISEVLPNSTAEAAGIEKGDILLMINEHSVASTNDVFKLIPAFTAGANFSFDVIREHKIVHGKSVFKSMPEEKYPGLATIYTQSNSAVGQQRIIITRPEENKKYPVVAFIGGIGCYSLDFPFDTTHAEVQLLNEISRAGYMTARLEKPGEGDNANHSKACAEVSFTEETNSYVAAINTLKKRDDVDSNAIYIFGHSMGGVLAPLIAQSTSIKGIVAYGTIGSNFQEYLMKTRRTIAQAYQMNPEETDDLVKDFCACSGYYFVEKLTTGEAAKKNRNCEEYLSIFDLRSRAYNDELYAFNIPALWKSFAGKALILWGESDYISSREDHEIVAHTINFYHPGNAQFDTIHQAAHELTFAESFVTAQTRIGQFNSNIAEVVIGWLKKQV